MEICENVTSKKASMEGLRKFLGALPFLGPFLFLIILFYLVPVTLTFVMSLTSMDYVLEWKFVGLENYLRFFQDSGVKTVVLNTVKYVFFTLIINVGFGFLLAIATSYFIRNENIRLLFQTIWMLPRMTPPVVYALLWLWFLDPTEAGMLNSFLGKLFGIPAQNWILNNPMKVVIIANGLIGASLGMVVFSAAIKSIPVDYFRAANVDGASDWQIIRYVIIPFLKWPIMFMTIWQTLSLITSYEYILLITDGGPLNKSEVWSLFSYHKAFSNYEFGYGAAISMVLVLIAVLIAILMLKVFGYDAIMRRGNVDGMRGEAGDESNKNHVAV
ncbi:MAG: inositol-phosphate transport system permease protein [Tepidanaerobacteraceae bacterium]|nr:inositol-phosphate transport system permease protein [Tepidanaerobacteraceae bacterium]